MEGCPDDLEPQSKPQGHKKGRRGRKAPRPGINSLVQEAVERARTPSSSLASESFSSLDLAGPSQGHREKAKPKGHRQGLWEFPKRGEMVKDQDSSLSLSSSSESECEERELPGEEEEGAVQPLDRLFPLEFFPRMLGKTRPALNLGNSLEEDSAEGPPKSKSNKLFLQGSPKPETVPFPEEFQRVLDNEQVQLVLPKHRAKLWNKLYSLPEETMQAFSVPVVDSLVVALSSAAVILSEG